MPTARSIYLIALLFLSASSCGDPEAFTRAMSRGKAHLENKESTDAVMDFTEATALDGRSAPAHRNLARARLLAQEPAMALEALAVAAALEPSSAATSYLTGLAYAHEARYAEAREHFDEAVRLDPHTPALRYQLAEALRRLKEIEKAAEQLEETLKLDPLHASAHFILSTVEQQRGRRAKAIAHIEEFKRLREIFGEASRKQDVLEACIHTRAELAPTRREPPEATPLRFADARPLLPDGPAVIAAAVLAVDEAGRSTLVAADADGALHLLKPGTAGGFEPVRIDLPSPTRDPGVPRQLLVANFHDEAPPERKYDPLRDAYNDVLAVYEDGLRLLRADATGGFEDLTAAAGLADLRVRRALWVDLEADGDLDLAVATSETLELWQNNGDGTFEEMTAAFGVDQPTAVDAAAADLVGNVVLDLVVAGGDESRVFLNTRDGSFRPRPDPPGPLPAARRVLVDDLDNDGWPDTVLLTANAVSPRGDTVLVVPGRGERRRLDLTGFEPTALELADVDNDGWLDVLAAGVGAVRIWRNGGSDLWNVTSIAIDSGDVHDLFVIDLDNDGDGDLLLLGEDGTRVLTNDTPQAGGRLALRLRGTKTNTAGLGTRVEVRRGTARIARTVRRLPVEIGLGNRTEDPLDAVQVVWTNGIVDNQIGVSDALLTIEEKNVAAGSCPFLYAWDGEDFRFVTDILGNSPLGLSLRRGVPLDADPDELVEIGRHLPARDGRFVVQVTEEMREVLYLDTARLVAIDHPSAVEFHPTDKLMPAPFPPSELWGLTGLRPPHRVEASDGVDRTADVAVLDGVFAPPGAPLPPPLRGQTRPLTLTLDFGPLGRVSPPDSPRGDSAEVLVLTGWLQYGDASVNIALSQGAAPVVPPRLEIEDAAGRVRPIDVVVGMPAGKTKTILVDLAGHLPPDTRRLRLTTSFEIRWDRIALGTKVERISRHVLEPVSAELAWRGFSEIRARAPGHPTTPRWGRVSERPPWRTALQGWVTRWGDVLELVAERDDRLALVAAGDALELGFDAAGLPPVPAGQERTFFFYSVGWDKDGDPNVIDGESVEPLPVAASGDWHRRYRTRWVPWDRFRK